MQNHTEFVYQSRLPGDIVFAVYRFPRVTKSLHLNLTVITLRFSENSHLISTVIDKERIQVLGSLDHN